MKKIEWIKLLIYSGIGFVLLLIAGLEFRTCVGFGVMFGFVIGLLNQIHTDMVKKEE